MEHQDIYWKLRHLIVPLAIASLVFTAVWTALAWLVELTGLPLDQDVMRYWLPGALALLLVYVVIGPHMRRLDFDPKRDASFLYMMVAAAAVAVPCYLAQWSAREATATVLPVSSAAEIAQAERAKFYVARKICVDRGRAGSYATLERDHRSNRPQSYILSVTAPVCGSNDKVWLAFTYRHGVGDASTDEELDLAYKAFVSDVEQRFNKVDPASFQYLERVGPGSDYRTFLKAVHTSRADADGVVLLRPHEEPFTRDAQGAAFWFAVSYLAGMGVWLLMVLLRPLDPDKPAKPDADEKLQRLLASQFYLPRRHHYGAAVLIDLNIAVYAAMALSGLGVLSFETDDLIAWGANYAPLNHGLGLVRLVTCQFVHSGLMHLFNNLYGLLFACMFLAPIAKNSRLIFCYLLCGTVGSIASMMVHPDTPSVGASGAIMGLWGMLLVLSALKDKRLENPKAIMLNIAIFTGLTLLLGAVMPGVDNVAHGGGLGAGLVLGLVLYLANGKKRAV